MRATSRALFTEVPRRSRNASLGLSREALYSFRVRRGLPTLAETARGRLAPGEKSHSPPASRVTGVSRRHPSASAGAFGARAEARTRAARPYRADLISPASSRPGEALIRPREKSRTKRPARERVSRYTSRAGSLICGACRGRRGPIT